MRVRCNPVVTAHHHHHHHRNEWSHRITPLKSHLSSYTVQEACGSSCCQGNKAWRPRAVGDRWSLQINLVFVLMYSTHIPLMATPTRVCMNKRWLILSAKSLAVVMIIREYTWLIWNITEVAIAIALQLSGVRKDWSGDGTGWQPRLWPVL